MRSDVLAAGQHSPVTQALVVAVSALLAVFVLWLVWKMISGALDAEKAQMRFYRGLVKRKSPRDPHD